MLLQQYDLQSCPKCNASFYNELLSFRSNTLTGQELLTAIANQNSSGLQYNQPLNSVVSIPKTGAIQSQSNYEKKEFIEIINRDNSLPIPPTSYVPQNTPPTKQVTIELYEGESYLGKGVLFKGFVTNGSIPGPTIIVDEGDIVEFTVVNKGNIPHGASIHAAYTQTSKYLGKIEPGNVHPGRHQFFDHFRRSGRRPQGADDLCLAVVSFYSVCPFR